LESGAVVVTHNSQWAFPVSTVTEFKLLDWNRVTWLLQRQSFGVGFLQSGQSLVLEWVEKVNEMITGCSETKLGNPREST